MQCLYFQSNVLFVFWENETATSPKLSPVPVWRSMLRLYQHMYTYLHGYKALWEWVCVKFASYLFVFIITSHRCCFFLGTPLCFFLLQKEKQYFIITKTAFQTALNILRWFTIILNDILISKGVQIVIYSNNKTCAVSLGYLLCWV